jgi:pantothenate synthetase
VEIADAATLKTAKDADKNKRLVALGAAYLGEIRLIDNIVISDGA